MLVKSVTPYIIATELQRQKLGQRILITADAGSWLLTEEFFTTLSPISFGSKIYVTWRLKELHVRQQTEHMYMPKPVRSGRNLAGKTIDLDRDYTVDINKWDMLRNEQAGSNRSDTTA